MTAKIVKEFHLQNQVETGLDHLLPASASPSSAK